MPDIIDIKGMMLIAKVFSVIDNGPSIAVVFELIGPFGLKRVEVKVTKDDLLEPGGASA